jgi:uncharacterized protein (TIGR02679 family)
MVPAALARPELRFVWEAIHDRYTRQAASTPVRSVTFAQLTEAQRHALADLLGLPRLPEATFTVQIQTLDQLLLDSDAAMTSRQLAEALCGPIVNRPEHNRIAQQAKEQLWERLHQTAGNRLAGWIQHLRASGLATRAATAAGQPFEQLVTQALAVTQLLPADGIALAELAERATGDPHALDRGRPLRTLVLHAVLQLTGEPPHLPASAAVQRALLETVGVYADSLSTDVLVLGLHAVGDTHVDRLLNEATAVGEPLRLTLRMLRRAPPILDPSLRLLSVCENPSIVATAAERLGATSAPLVCTDGMPRTAVLRLLNHARSQQLAIRVSADFDPAGLHITNLLARQADASPWRYTAQEYRRALADHPGREPVRFSGALPNCVLDPDLAVEMRRTRVAIFEEQQLDLLLDDLSRPGFVAGTITSQIR